MRNSAQACEDLLARLFTDAELRARFRQDSQGVGREFGLDEAALTTVRNIDWAGLDLAARSYSHKAEARAKRKRSWWPFR